MLPDHRFVNQTKLFWANIRTISQRGGYTDRKTGQIRTYSVAEMVGVIESLGLSSDYLVSDSVPTRLGVDLEAYFAYRAETLNHVVFGLLMGLQEAEAVFVAEYERLQPKCPVPLIKQKGDMRTPAYLTGLVNMTIEAGIKGLPVDYDPKELTTVTFERMPLRTFARRLDGCFPSSIDPIAVWEVKEYYHNKSFGSRIADGVYESLLDGMEFEELRTAEGIHIQHLLIIDDRTTWWNRGRAYLCRIIDMLNMGYVDEVLFGREVLTRLPLIVEQWITLYNQRALNS